MIFVRVFLENKLPHGILINIYLADFVWHIPFII